MRVNESSEFRLVSPFEPAGDQPKAIEATIKDSRSPKEGETLWLRDPSGTRESCSLESQLSALWGFSGCG
jgi:excinuclease UvrABC helicase subunit UvrB